jgi:hypothetical protein
MTTLAKLSSESMFSTESHSANTDQSIPEFNPEAIANIWADSIVDDAGYADENDRILARYEQVDRLFPSADELRSRGINVLLLAACIQENMIVLDSFNDTINRLSSSELNQTLEHLLETSEAFTAHPDDALDRSMHFQSCCDCHRPN